MQLTTVLVVEHIPWIKASRIYSMFMVINIEVFPMHSDNYSPSVTQGSRWRLPLSPMVINLNKY